MTWLEAWACTSLVIAGLLLLALAWEDATVRAARERVNDPGR